MNGLLTLIVRKGVVGMSLGGRKGLLNWRQWSIPVIGNCRTVMSKDPNYPRARKKLWKYGLKPEETLEEFEQMVYKIHFVQVEQLGEKLKLAALYMQATEGPNMSKEPKKENHYEHSYWTAWKQLENMNKEQAKQQYVELAKKFMKPIPEDLLYNDP